MPHRADTLFLPGGGPVTNLQRSSGFIAFVRQTCETFMSSERPGGAGEQVCSGESGSASPPS